MQGAFGRPEPALRMGLVALALAGLALSVAPAQAASQQTTLCVVNQSTMEITIQANVANNQDWDGDSRPDKNFNGRKIPAYDSLCQREEINTAASSANYSMSIRFSDNTQIQFSDDQLRAESKRNRILKTQAPWQIYQGSGGEMNGIYVQPVTAPDNSGWMGKLFDKNNDLRMYQIAMPGSHDAGMYETHGCATGTSPEWAQTQNLRILDQLKAGSRYFDLRPYGANKTIYVGHFSSVGGCYGAPLQDILNDVKAFLTGAGSREAVFLKFSHTNNGNTDGLKQIESMVVQMVLTTLKGLLYTTTERPTIANVHLKNLMGKAVALFDCEYSKDINQDRNYFSLTEGTFPYVDLYDKGSTWCSGGYPSRKVGLAAYDNYANSDSLTDMTKDQLSKLKAFGGDKGEYLFLFSWTLTAQTGGFLLDIEVLSSMAKPALPQVLTRIKNGTLNKANII
jgi:1-phosphatidylinositol phosphodiesterase